MSINVQVFKATDMFDREFTFSMNTSTNNTISVSINFKDNHISQLTEKDMYVCKPDKSCLSFAKLSSEDKVNYFKELKDKFANLEIVNDIETVAFSRVNRILNKVRRIDLTTDK